MNPIISIIVPTYNSTLLMRDFLNSCLASEFKNFEVIVNDDLRSNDNLDQLCAEYKNKGLSIIYIKENKSMAQGRKRGAQVVSGTHLLHLDSDMQVTHSLFGECAELSQKFDALVIPEESFGTTFWARCKWLEKKCFQGVEQLESLRFIKKDIYDKLGGHDERMVFSEDKDFDLRVREAGYKIGRVNAHLMHNEGDLKLIKTLKKKLGYSKTANVFADEHPEHFRWQANPLHRYVIFARNIKYLFTHPFLYIGMVFMKTCEYGAATTGIVVNLLKSTLNK